MNQRMTWNEIKINYPNEWVALDDYEIEGPLEVNGMIIAHNAERKKFYSAVEKIRNQHLDIAVRYTGELIKNPDIPLLWQITNTE